MNADTLKTIANLVELLVYEINDFDTLESAVDAVASLVGAEYQDFVFDEFTMNCIESQICPRCGTKLSSKQTIMNVHPYGSTTAAEYDYVLYCDSCGWEDEA